MRRKLFAGMLAVLLCFLPLWGVRAEGEPYVVQDNASRQRMYSSYRRKCNSFMLTQASYSAFLRKPR